MSIASFFGDRLNSAREGFTQGVRAREQDIQQQKTNNVLRAHQVAASEASQYGPVGSQAWTQAYTTIAKQGGVPDDMIESVSRLAMDPRMSQLMQNAQRINQAKQNYNPVTMEPYVPDLSDKQVDTYDIRTGERVYNGVPTGMVAPGFPGAPTKGSPNATSMLTGGQGQTSIQVPNAPASAAPISSFFVPDNLVTPATKPTTMSDIGISSDDEAEQFQALEGMVGKAMPDFDLRADYKRDPAFYRELLSVIQKGVPDENSPGQRRKLSIKEIIALIQE